jgi:signal transduction histidine kinase
VDIVVEVLRQAPLLAGLPDEALKQLAEVAQEQRYDPGAVIIREGAEDDGLYIIVSGSVDIVKGYETPHQEKITERGPFDVVGEMRLVEDAPRFATVVAAYPTVVYAIPYDPFREIARGQPGLLARLLTLLSGKVRQARGDLYAELVRKHQETAALADFQRAVLRGVVAHELRTPIANILLTLEIACRNPATLTPEELRRILSDLNRNAAAVRQRVDCLVDYLALAGRQGEMFPQPVDFAELARRTARKYTAQAAEVPVRLEQKIAAESLPLQGDGNRLGDAMAHLLDNAVKFNRPGGLAVVLVWQKAGAAYYEVDDTGVGIPADRLERLWEPFMQGADPLRRGLEGLGLGLALTRYIARAHGGDVWAESAEGRGSKFGFWVPIREAAGGS